MRSTTARYPDGPGALKFDPSEPDLWNSGSESGPGSGELAVLALSQQRQLEAARLLDAGKAELALDLARAIPAAGIRAQMLTVVASEAGDTQLGRSTLKSAIEATDAIREDPKSRVSARLLIARLARRWKEDELAKSSLVKAFSDSTAVLKKDQDADNPNRAPREYWPSTQAARQAAYTAGKILDPAGAEALLGGITDPELALLATIESARGLLDLAERSSKSATRFEK